MTENAKDPQQALTARGPEVSATSGSTALTVPQGSTVAQQLRQRRAGAYRLPALSCGHRDPLDCAVSPDGPGTYGLTDDELRAHAAQLIRCGWSLAEVRTRLAVQPLLGVVA